MSDNVENMVSEKEIEELKDKVINLCILVNDVIAECPIPWSLHGHVEEILKISNPILQELMDKNGKREEKDV